MSSSRSSKLKLSRRTLLRGAAGAAIGLPVLEAMLDSRGTALAAPGDDSELPCRYVVMLAGQALGCDGVERDGHFIVPPETGSGYTVTTPLQPLAELDLMGDFSLVSGLLIPWNTADNVPAGGTYPEFHTSAVGPLLSGVRSLSYSAAARGPTTDWVVSQQIGADLPHPLLAYRAQAAWYLSESAPYGRDIITYKGDNDPLVPTVSPSLAFDALFGNFSAGEDPQEVARRDFARRGRRSVLDAVLKSRDRLLGKLGGWDKQRVSDHFDQIRDLETSLANIPPEVVGICQPLADPGSDPPIGDNNAGASASEIGTTTGYSNEDLRARVFCDLIHMAFACDQSRVASLLLTMFQSHMNMYQLTGIRADLHEIGHRGDPAFTSTEAVSIALRWHLTHYAYLLHKLKSTPEGDGTMLDRTAAVFLTEAGHGTSMEDGADNATHSTENMAVLVGGHVGGLQAGQHIVAEGRHPIEVMHSAMRAVGVTTEVGEVSGHVEELLG